MAYRSDITIYWHLDPRIIEIADTSAYVTIQDLYDTIRELEQRPQNMQHAKLCDAFGNIELGGGKFTIVTLILLDASVKFADRSGPAIVQCDIEDGNIVAYDTDTQLFVSPIEKSDFTQPIIHQATTGAAVGVSLTNIANAVWKALRSAYNTADSMGEAMGLIPTMNTVVDTIDGKIDAQDIVLAGIDSKLDTIGLQTLPTYEVRQTWNDDISNSLFRVEASVLENGASYTPGGTATCVFELEYGGAIVHTVSGVAMDATGIFRSYIAYANFNPPHGQNFSCTATITDGLSTHVGDTGVARIAFTS